jgi:hypothetical protein
MKKLLQAKTFIIPAMRAGLCEYSEERVLVTNETLAKMAQTSFGIPLIIDHVEQEELEKNLEKYICGRVASMHYDAAQDLWMAHCVADTEEAVTLFDKGYGVSTSYQVDNKADGGTLNGVKYNSEIIEGTYLHLAIVENPRYEMAKDPVFYNSKELTKKSDNSNIELPTPQEGEFVMKFWRTKREEVKENSSDMEVEIDGENVSMSALVVAYKAVKLNAKKNDEDKEKKEKEEEEKLNAEADALLKDLEKDDKKNAEDEEVDKKKKDEEEEKKNAEEAEEKKKKDEEKNKKNSRFDSMQNSSDKSVLNNEIQQFKTLQQRAEIGRQRYGSAK